MRTIILTLLLFSFICIVIELPLNAQSTGYFHIKDKTFYDPDGNEFYPLVLNYSCEMACDPNNVNPANSLTDFFISPIPGYGSTDVIECTSTVDCIQNKIHNDFLKIRSMGFNTIRLNGVGFYKNDDQSTGGVFHYGWDGSTGKKREWPILPPYSSSTGAAQYIFNLLGLVMQEAESCTLAVILDETENGFTVHKSVDWNLYINDYIQYAKEKAEYFKAYRNLLAYIFIEEPPHDGFSKMEICDFTTDLYNTVKDADPNHLITYGGGLRDVLAWDPSIVKVDFYSPHYYSNWSDVDDPQFSLTNFYNRMLGMIYYTGQISPLPWIIGEIGFSAIDDDYIGMNFPPYCDGTIWDQNYFASASLDWVRDCNASGYSWWNYQENRWSSPIQDGYGLLRHEDNLNSITIEKPAVGAFRNYLTNNIARPIHANSCNKPSNYYDPFNLEVINPVDSNIITCTILDASTNMPIENALAFSWVNYIDLDSINTNIKYRKTISRYTFSDITGIINLNPYCIHNSNILPFVKFVKISCVGCDIWNEGDWDSTAIPPLLTNGNKFISKNHYEIIQNTSGISVNSGQIINFYGWLQLHLNDISINSGAISNITARNEVLINSEFMSSNGSDVHIFLSDNCQTFSSYQSARIAEQLNGSNENNKIILTFNIDINDIKIIPNPTSGKIIVSMINGINLNKYIITNINSQTISEGEILSENYEIDLSRLSKGLYFICIYNEKQTYRNKIIIQ